MLRLALLLLSLWVAFPALGRESRQFDATPPIRLAALPEEARETLMAIRRGGPFPYRKDGSIFGNHEQRLPARPRGYYREYTVATPGARDRGARRIVAGQGATGDVRTSGEYYYTDNHYRSFRKIVE